MRLRPGRERLFSTTAGAAMSAFLLGVALTLIASAAAFWLVRRSGFTIDTSRPAVARHVQQLQRLETVVYGMDKIVTGERESQLLPRALVGDRILLIVYGEVTAGVDLGQVDGEGIVVNGRSVELTLPPAEVFSTRIDNGRSRVYARETGLFSSPDPNLESEVRREAENQVRQAALESGILLTATKNAQTTLTTFLNGLGFEEVIIR
jgi:hypothetical protein